MKEYDFKNLEPLEFTDLNKYDLIEKVRNNLFDRIEEVIKTVLCQYLKREVSIDDAKNTTLISTEEFPQKYFLQYNEVILGTIIISFEQQRIIFTPTSYS